MRVATIESGARPRLFLEEAAEGPKTLELSVSSSMHPYSVLIQTGCVTSSRSAVPYLSALEPARTILVCDRNLAKFHPELPVIKFMRGRTVWFHAREDRKTLAGVKALLEVFLKKGVMRNHTVIALGGGIVQDAVGFACQTYARGLNWWFLPGTLLSQADSCVGSKTSLNFASTKNLLGSFYPPHRIFIDPHLLRTLRPLDVVSGLGEILKVHCMDTQETLAEFSRDVTRLKNLDGPCVERYIFRSLAIKLRYVEGDEFDRGPRQVLNLGHCYGHALEAVSRFRVPHGVAVIVGIVMAYRLSLMRGYVSEGEFDGVLGAAAKLLEGIRLPPASLRDVLFHIRRDKKRETPDLAVILTRGVGRPFKATDVKEDEFSFSHRWVTEWSALRAEGRDGPVP